MSIVLYKIAQFTQNYGVNRALNAGVTTTNSSHVGTKP